jgi:hypothetical protein
MNEFERIKPNSQKDGTKQSARVVPLWQRPALTFLGRVKDLVKGGGKSGFTGDQDPVGTFNTGRKP